MDKINSGEMKIEIHDMGGKVVIDFNTQLSWVAYDYEDMRTFAESILKVLDNAEHKGLKNGC